MVQPQIWKVVVVFMVIALFMMVFMIHQNRTNATGSQGVSAPQQPVYTGPLKRIVNVVSMDKGASPGVNSNWYKHTKTHPNPILQKIRDKGVSFNLAAANVDAMTEEDLKLTIHSITDNTDTFCARKLRMGQLDDGGWEICDDPDVSPDPPCVMYSFGIAGDWSFDDESSKVYGCHIYSFDPSINQATYNRSNLISFFRIGISGTTMVNSKKWQLFTFNDIRKKMGHENKKIDVVKMDVEGAEWDTLPQMLASGAMQSINQLLVEYHVTGHDRKWLLPRVKMMQEIEKAGFKKFYAHKNWHCGRAIPPFPIKRTLCYEVHYVRRP